MKGMGPENRVLLFLFCFVLQSLHMLLKVRCTLKYTWHTLTSHVHNQCTDFLCDLRLRLCMRHHSWSAHKLFCGSIVRMLEPLSGAREEITVHNEGLYKAINFFVGDSKLKQRHWKTGRILQGHKHYSCYIARKTEDSTDHKIKGKNHVFLASGGFKNSVWPPPLLPPLKTFHLCQFRGKV